MSLTFLYQFRKNLADLALISPYQPSVCLDKFLYLTVWRQHCFEYDAISSSSHLCYSSYQIYRVEG